MTSTLIEQLDPVLTLPPVSDITPVPAVAVKVPLQLLVEFAGLATVIAAGRLSVKSRSVKPMVPALLSIEKVSVLVVPEAMASGAKTFTKPASDVTARVSFAVPLLPDDEVRSPVVLTCEPVVSLVTSTLIEQLVPLPTLPPVSEITLVPAAAVKAPPQVLVVLAGLATVITAGRLSVKARLVAASAEAELSILKVKILTSPVAIKSGAKLLAKIGAGSIVRLAVAGTATG